MLVNDNGIIIDGNSRRNLQGKLPENTIERETEVDINNLDERTSWNTS